MTDHDGVPIFEQGATHVVGVYGTQLPEPPDSGLVRCRPPSKYLHGAAHHPGMSLTTDDFEVFVAPDPEDDETVPLGEVLEALAVDADIDSVTVVRDGREQT